MLGVGRRDRQRSAQTAPLPCCPASTRFAELSSTNSAGSPPLPGLVAGRHRCGNRVRKTPI